MCYNCESSVISWPNLPHPATGSRPFHPQEFTPTSLSLHPAPSVSPFTMQRTHSPSPAILNFTLQNIGLIPTAAGVAGGTSSPMTVEHASPLPTAHIGLPHRGMIFVKPMSSAGALQHPPSSQPLTLFSLAQVRLTAHKSSVAIEEIMRLRLFLFALTSGLAGFTSYLMLSINSYNLNEIISPFNVIKVF